MRLRELTAAGLLVLAAATWSAAIEEEGGVHEIPPVPETEIQATITDNPFDPEEGWTGDDVIARVEGDALVLGDRYHLMAPDVLLYYRDGSEAGPGAFVKGTPVRYRLDVEGDLTAIMINR